MSFRELRNFCEIMRALGYPRLISMQNFQKPNFELVADILFWLAHRYDPKAQISDDIEDQKSRIEFIKSISTMFALKAHIKLNPKKLYQADGYACQEILKIATMLYNAYFWEKIDDDSSEFSLPSRFGNTKDLKQNADDINKIGTSIFDLLSKENEVKIARDKALAFLENLHSFDSKEGEQYIEKCVKDIVNNQEEQINQMSKYIKNLERDEKLIEEKIHKKGMDLERAEKRFQTLTNVKPAYMDEYERLEHELEKIYQIYIEKFRNLEYLEHELDQYNIQELEKFEQSRKKLEKWASVLQKEEMDILTGKKEIDLNAVEQQIKEAADNKPDSRPESKLDQKKKKEWSNAQKQMMQENGFFGGAFKKNMAQGSEQIAVNNQEDDGELEVGGDEDEEGELEGDEDEEIDGSGSRSGSNSDHNF